MTEPSPALVAVLEADRDALNARFAQRLYAGARIDGDAFLRHLRDAVAPLVDLVHAEMPERSRTIVSPLFDVSLDLFSVSLLGPEARFPWVTRVWEDVLPHTTRLLARDPQQVAGCLCNAAVQIASQRGARPRQWLNRMQQIARYCQTLPELLQAGVIAAWQAGMVQYRRTAIEAARTLRVPLATAALGLDETTSPKEMPRIIDRLRDQKWLTAEAAGKLPQKPAIACVARAGAFSGFGGVFLRPPRVAADGPRLLVSDGNSQWQLLADAYGVAFHKTGDAPAKQAESSGPLPVNIDRKGNIRWENLSLSQPHLAKATSLAFSAETLAVTIATSHHVFLYTILGSSA